jgi:ubiquitin-activating enzyme E1
MGVEIAKNNIMSSFRKVHLYDNNLVTSIDLSYNFFSSQDKIGQRRDISSLEGLRNLNFYTEVDFLETFEIEKIENYGIVYLTDLIFSYEQICKIDKYCSMNGVKFIFSLNIGLSIFVFNNFGSNFKVTNPDGNESKVLNIQEIIFEERLCFTFDNTDNLIVFRGQKFIFNNLSENSNLYNKIFTVVNVEGRKITTDLTDINEENLILYANSQIQVIEYKEEKILDFLPFSEAISNYSLIQDYVYDYEDYDRPKTLLKLLKLLLMFKMENDFVVNQNQEEEFELNYNKFKQYINEQSFKEKFDIYYYEKTILNFFKFHKMNFSPLCCLGGGIACQEAIKIFGVYTPIHQFFVYDVLELSSDSIYFNESNFPSIQNDLDKYNCLRYILGENVCEKLKSLRVFMIGAGALGCEYLKLFSQLGIGEEGKIICTDSDSISVSNTTRQFLFSESDKGKNKSQVACRKTVLNNKNLKIESYNLLLDSNSLKEHFDYSFFDNLDVLISAVDNIKARQLLDQINLFHKKIYLEAGTNGLKLHTNIFIPDFTNCYNSITHPNIKETPSCTIKYFPYEFRHCVEWAKSYIFNTIFFERVSDFLIFMKSKDNLLSDFSKRINEGIYYINRMKELKLLIEIYEGKKIDNCFKFANYLFNENFNREIKMLLKCIPHESFPNGKCPKYIDFDYSNNLHKNFVKNLILIMSKIFKLKGIFELDQFEKVIQSHNLFNKELDSTTSTSNQNIEVDGDFISEIGLEKNIKLKITENNTNNIDNNLKKQEFENLLEYFKNMSLENFDKKELLVNVLEFDKDDDIHLEFLYTCSLLKAYIFGIKENSIEETRVIAGKIIPAVASSTSVAVGYNMIELIKYASNRGEPKRINFDLGTCDFQYFFQDNYDEGNYLVLKKLNCFLNN